MRLALIDENRLAALQEDQQRVVLCSWEDPASARAELADLIAQELAPRKRLHRGRRARFVAVIDAALLRFQQESIRL